MWTSRHLGWRWSRPDPARVWCSGANKRRIGPPVKSREPHRPPGRPDASFRAGPPSTGAMKAILLIDHGSRRDAANEMMDCMANLVQAMAGADVVIRYAHMELAEPSIS